MAADHGDTGAVPGRPAVGGRVKIEGVLGLFHHSTVQHQLSRGHAGSIWGASSQLTGAVGGELVLLSQHALHCVGENRALHAVHDHIAHRNLAVQGLIPALRIRG